MQARYSVPVDDWWNIHLNSYLLLQDFIINLFIFYVYMIISLFEQLKTGTNCKLFTREEKKLLLALNNFNNLLFEKSLAAQVTDFKPQVQLLLFSQKFQICLLKHG